MMNPAVPKRETNRNASRREIVRLTFGGTLIGLSIWGMVLCSEVFRVSLGPGSSPMDSDFANLGARVSWILFFGPVAAAGIVTVWSTLRKMGALEQFASWLSAFAGGSGGLSEGHAPHAGVVSAGRTDLPHGLENLNAETVKRLQRTALRTAVVLGGLAGASSLGLGIFGLVYLLCIAKPYAGSSVYESWATGRLTIAFAVFSGISVLVGVTILLRTFRKENNAWLLPLQLFTYTVLRQGQTGRGAGGAGRAQPHRPNRKPHPRD
jgi:hypothetical protein